MFWLYSSLYCLPRVGQNRTPICTLHDHIFVDSTAKHTVHTLYIYISRLYLENWPEPFAQTVYGQMYGKFPDNITQYTLPERVWVRFWPTLLYSLCTHSILLTLHPLTLLTLHPLTLLTLHPLYPTHFAPTHPTHFAPTHPTLLTLYTTPYEPWPSTDWMLTCRVKGHVCVFCVSVCVCLLRKCVCVWVHVGKWMWVHVGEWMCVFVSIE
jgi:hypothetical protein